MTNDVDNATQYAAGARVRYLVEQGSSSAPVRDQAHVGSARPIANWALRIPKQKGLSGSDLSAFGAKLSLEPSTMDFWSSDLRGYLPGSDSEAFLQIKDLVTRKATSEYEADPAITRLGILWVVGCDDDC